MAAIPPPLNQTVHLIHGMHERRIAQQRPRDYLGWSQIGTPCERALWYSFRWFDRKPFDGRIARLFDTGHREEARVLQELRDAGIEVWDRDPGTGDQYEVFSLAGHFRGHLDAIVLGLPEAPKTPHLVDVKTTKVEKFEELVKKGMRALFPTYWAQGHGYMGHMGLKRAAFIFVCKDDDRIHVERFEFDEREFQKYEQRAKRIVRSVEPPLRISEDPAWYECKLCDFYAACREVPAPPVHCRTCTHATPMLEGDDHPWRCEHYGAHIPLDDQREGCHQHRYIPVLLERVGKPIDVMGEHDVIYEAPDGKTFINGEPPDGFTSAEIRACADKRALTAIPEMQQWRRELGATIVR